MHLVWWLNSSIRPIDRTLTGVTIPGQSETGSNVNVRKLKISQMSRTGASPSDSLVSYPGKLLGESYPSAEKQSVYSTDPADWALAFSLNLMDSCIKKII